MPFAEVDKRFTRRPSLQVPSSAQAGHGDVVTPPRVAERTGQGR